MIEATVHYQHQGGSYTSYDAEIEIRSDRSGPHAQIHITDDDGRLTVITLSPADLERLGDKIADHSKKMSAWQQYGE